MVKYKPQSSYLDKKEEWAELYRQGMSFTQIAKREGVFYRTVQKVIKDVVDIRPKQQYSEQAKEWAKLYEEGWSSPEIANKYKVGVNTVTKYLKTLGVELRRQPKRERQFDEYVEEWVKLYEQEGKSLKEIADQYGCHFQTVHNYIKDKTTMRWYTETSRRYNLNEYYFEKIDSPTKAYWLGYWFASGSVSEGATGYSTQLSVTEKDVDRMNAFKQEINAEIPIYTDTSTDIPRHQLKINNKILYESLIKQGLKGDKTDTLAFPDTLDSAYYSFFVLGYYEGRGSCYNTKGKNRNGTTSVRTVIQISGTHTMLETIQQIILREVGVRFTLRSGETSLSSPRYLLEMRSWEDIQKFADWLYKGKEEYSKEREIREVLKKRKAMGELGDEG